MKECCIFSSRKHMSAWRACVKAIPKKKKKRCCHPLVQSSLFAQAVLHDLHCQNIRNVISKATEGNTVYLSLYKQSQTRKWEAVGTPIKDFAGLSLCLFFVCVTKYKTLCYIR